MVWTRIVHALVIVGGSLLLLVADHLGHLAVDQHALLPLGGLPVLDKLHLIQDHFLYEFNLVVVG